MGRNTSGAAFAAPFTPGRIRTGVAGVVVAVIAALTLSVAPAGATTGHVVQSTFGIPGSNDLGGFPSFGGPTGVVVDQATGDVYATDPAHTDGVGGPAPRVERFDSTGTPEAEFPIDGTQYSGPQSLAIDPTNGSLYVGASDTSFQGVVLRYALDGTPQGTLTPDAGTFFNPGALAVDPSNGDVYVGATDGSGLPLVEVFDDGGVFQTSFNGGNGNDGPFGSVNALAVDGSGQLYVTDGGKQRVDRFSSTGAFQATVVNGALRGVTPGALAIDATDDELYVVENNSQVEYLTITAGGADHQDVFNPFGVNIVGAAVNDGTDTVYLADSAQSIGLIAGPVPGPTVETTGSSGVGTTSATLEGSINPENNDATYRFEYGTDGVNYGQATPDLPAGNGGSTDPVTANPTDLLPNSTYHFRIVGTNANTGVTIYGGDLTFHTDPAPPIVDGTPPSVSPPVASDIKPNGATITGTVNPRGSSTTYSVEYGPNTSYGSTQAGAQPLEGQGDQPAPVTLSGLTADTVYHYRIVADNGVGTTQRGADATFRTAPATPAGAASVNAVSATLVGTIRLNGHPTKYQFEWGTDTNYGHLTSLKDALGTTGEVTVTDKLDDLTPGTTYYVRAIALDTTTNVTTTGVGGTFTTDPAATATTGAVTGVTPTQATFSGEVNTHDLGGTYRFYVESTTSTYVASTTTATIPAGVAAGPVSGALTDLRPGQTYRVRLVAVSSGYTALGDTVEFTTPPEPPILPPPPPPTVDNPYGCTAPVLNAYNQHPKPGDTIRVGGADLGTGGSIALGGRSVAPTSWSASSITFVLPDDAKGSLPLTINCGKASNTVAVQMYQAPSNKITIKSKVKKATATLTIKVPGPGDLKVTGPDVRTVKRHVGKAGTYTVKASLTTAGKRSVRRHKSLPRSLSVTFTPNGGTAGKKTAKVTYRR